MASRAEVAPGARVRLSKAERRAQLLQIGTAIVLESSFEELSVDDVASRAGISRGLLFHYFPTRADFLVAIAEQATQRLLDSTDVDVSSEPLVRIAEGVDAYLDFIEEQGDAYVSMIRGAAAGEPGLRAVADRGREVLVQRGVDAVEQLLGHEVPPGGRLLLRGWLMLAEEMCVTWLRQPPAERIAREDLQGLILGSLVALAPLQGLPPEALQ